MKNLKKVIVAASLCAAIGATAIAGTLAYFTDTDTKTNTFTAGDLDITLTETDWDASGSTIATSLVPGDTFAKDPTVTVEENSVASYVRMVLKIDNAIYNNSNLKSGDHTVVFQFQNENDGAYSDGVSSDWDLVTDDGTLFVADFKEEGYTYLVYQQEVSATNVDVTLDSLFDQIKIPDTVTTTDVETIANVGKNVVVTAYAVQAENMDDAADAFSSGFNTIFAK